MFSAALLLSCAANHGVRPLGKGNVAATGSFGGPVIEAFGGPFPMPLSTLGVRYGLSDRSDVHASVHPSLAGMFGLIGVDAGASYLVAPQLGPRPALLVDGTLLVVGGDTVEGDPEGGVRAFVDTALLASWSWGERGHLAYTGAELFLQPSPWRLYGAPVLGNRFQVSRRLGLALELRWIDPWAPTEHLTVEFYAPRRHGAVTVHAGLHVGFGPGYREE